MFSRFSIPDANWQQTPTAVQQAFSSLYHQLLLELRSQAYEHQLVQLREQIAQSDDLKAQMADLRERLGQNCGRRSIMWMRQAGVNTTNCIGYGWQRRRR
jgi:hypothetical protein